MPFYFWCVLAMMAILYFSKIPVGIAMNQAGGYDNRNPRDQQARLTGWGRRATAAHQNGFEIFPLFGVSVLMAHVLEVNPHWVNLLAGYFVVSRVVYIALYIGNVDKARSLVWMSGLLSCFALAAGKVLF
jgi:uncharacterized MAPEG superfamily protein